MKTCKRCGVKFSETGFYARDSTCKVCRRTLVRGYRTDNIEKVREYDRNRPNKAERAEANKRNYRKRISTPDGRAREWAAKKKSAANKAYGAAHTIVGNALRAGTLKPKPCERCSFPFGLHAHHEDYSKPLDVNWLCTKCHGERHREINEEKRRNAA